MLRISKNTSYLSFLVLFIVLLSGCSQSPKKTEIPIQPIENKIQSVPLASDLSSKDEYEFALDLAGLELNRQRYERAEGLLQKLRKIDREDTRVYRLLAQVYEAQKKRIWHWSHGNKSINQLIRR